MTHRGNPTGGGQGSAPSGGSPEVLQQLLAKMHDTGFEASELIVAIDFTKSNRWTGKESFEGRSLHDVSGPTNPYMDTLNFIGNELQFLDDDSLIPCYGFGDTRTGQESVFSFYANNVPARGLGSLVERYKQMVSIVDMSGPTTFAPLIRQAMHDVYGSGMKFHVLVILADGQVSEECLEETRLAITEAASFPMFIFMIGVGDGPWESMQMFDDQSLPDRAWDNFYFFQHNKVATGGPEAEGSELDQMTAKLLDEIPKQFAEARKLVGQTNSQRVQTIINALPNNLVIDPPGGQS